MKTITEVERRELEDKLNVAAGRAEVDHPWPEFFLAMGLSAEDYSEQLQEQRVPAEQAAEVAKMVEAQPGHGMITPHETYGVPAGYKAAPLHLWRDLVVSSSNVKYGSQVLWRFRLN